VVIVSNMPAITSPLAARPATVPVEHKPSGLPVKRVAAPAGTRQSTFPAPSELSDQEKALLSLMGPKEQTLAALARVYPFETVSAEIVSTENLEIVGRIP
jgi:hypothetical protein